jgi:Uma2 family endonuclease
VPYSKWPWNRPVPDDNAWEVLPDLFVEVVSPIDRVEEAREKVEEYLQAGAKLIWVIYPRLQVVDVIEPPGVARTLRRADELDGGPVLPGFRLKLADLFPATTTEEPKAQT